MELIDWQIAVQKIKSATERIALQQEFRPFIIHDLPSKHGDLRAKACSFTIFWGFQKWDPKTMPSEGMVILAMKSQKERNFLLKLESWDPRCVWENSQIFDGIISPIGMVIFTEYTHFETHLDMEKSRFLSFFCFLDVNVNYPRTDTMVQYWIYVLMSGSHSGI